MDAHQEPEETNIISDAEPMGVGVTAAVAAAAVASAYAGDNEELLPAREMRAAKKHNDAADKEGLQTPETATPQVRSVSPSSDGGASLSASDRGVSRASGSTAGEATPAAHRSNKCTEAMTAPEPQCEDEAEPPRDASENHDGQQESANDDAEKDPVGQNDDALSATDCTDGSPLVETDDSRGSGATDSEVSSKASTEQGSSQVEGGEGASAPPSSSRSRERRRDEDGRQRGRGPNGRAGESCETGAGSADSDLAAATPRLMVLQPNQSAGHHAAKDRRIIEVLAASEARHDKLWECAHRVEHVLSEGTELFANRELYGSLSLYTHHQNSDDCGMAQDWARYYVHSRSDVDYVVELKPNVPPAAVVQKVMSKGNWKLVQETRVAKFCTLQYTLLGSFKGEAEEAESEQDSPPSGADQVYLDLTCIEKPIHFKRFKKRQEAFRRTFFEVRQQMEAQFQGLGVLAFDAYIHLLKAFAGKVPGNALTGFQATCIGLFTLRINFFRLRQSQSIAVAFFEGFLRFCVQFYGEPPRLPGFCFPGANYRHFAIDLSLGQWMPRRELCWRSEMYFQAVEAKLQTHAHECVNIAHSLDPARVCAEATSLLQRAFRGSNFEGVPGMPGLLPCMW
eukprot:CAMPEP_0178410188 /NCGR_PEP_ID=MMETSP0689_2-20121128/20850_1 /TAXON_ID=160604 /ORGANISM="Amphidinium massartii, Strain CS-259" /LENGTH=623 /DNA_ID=CAMNT_0020031355 /DNA_START=27 /DNA_END=1895 /DNA_ORIENTATION=+